MHTPARAASRVNGLHTALFSAPRSSVLRKCLLKVRLSPDPAVITIPLLCHSSSLDLNPNRPVFPVSAALFLPTERVPCYVLFATHWAVLNRSSADFAPIFAGVHSLSRSANSVEGLRGTLHRSSRRTQPCLGLVRISNLLDATPQPHHHHPRLSEIPPTRACRRIHTTTIHHGRIRARPDLRHDVRDHKQVRRLPHIAWERIVDNMQIH